MVHVLWHAFLLVAAALVAWLPGVVLERRFLPSPDADLRWLVRWILGLGWWTLGIFAFASMQLLEPWFLVLHVLAVPLVTGAALLHRSGEAAAGRPIQAPRARDPLVAGLLGATFLAVLAPAFLLAINPTVSWDASSYHLTLPRLYLEHAGFRPVPMNVYSAWPLGVELLFAPALLLGGQELAKLVHFGFGVLVLATIVRTSGGVGRLAGWLGAALFLLNGVVLFEIRVAYIDLGHAFYLLAAVLFTDRALRADTSGDDSARRRWLLLGGTAAGLVASVKITGIASVGLVVLALLGPWLVACLRRDGFGRTSLVSTARVVLPWAGPAAIAWVAWLVRSAALTGNPVYPFLYRAFGGPDWSVALGEQLAAWQRGIGMGREPLDYLLLPLRVVLLGGRGYDRFDGEIAAFWLVAVPLALVFLWRARRTASPRSTLARRALVVAALHFVFWAATAQQSRFLIPTLGLLALAVALALAGPLERLDGRKTRLAAVALAVTIASVFVTTEADLLRSGAQHLRLYLDPAVDLDERRPWAPVFDVVDTLPTDAKILMLHTNQGYFCRREYLADSFFEASQIADWLAGAGTPNAIRGRLEMRDVTHVLLDRRPRGAVYPEALFDFLRDPSQVQPIHQDDRHVLFVLR